jgi:anti-anti-sigma regulatory factor
MIGNIRIRERRTPMRALLRVEGRVLAGPAAGRLLARVRRALSFGARVLVLDLSGVAAIDGGGIGMLLACWRAARQRNATLLVRRARGPARRTLELSALLGPLEGGLPGPAGRRGPDALLLQSA